jgi:hypothetical protein
MSLRILIASMVICLGLGGVLLGFFWHATPARVDASSGGNPAQNAQPPQNSTNP